MPQKKSRIIHGCALQALSQIPSQSVQTCITSPPYWGLRDYGVKGQLGLEPTPDEYVANMVEVFREVRRVLKDNGTCWLNLGDSYATGGTGGSSYKSTLSNGKGITPQSKQALMNAKSISRSAPAGLKHKDLVGIPWRVAFALQADGWYLRSDIIWHKPNPMPESVMDRPTRAHEYLFLLAKNERYLYDTDAIREPYAENSLGRYNYLQTNKGKQVGGRRPGREWVHERTKQSPNPLGRQRRTVWTVTTQPFKGAHFATFPPALIEPCVLAGSGPGDLVLDPFNGAGTTGLVALNHGRRYLGIELNKKYIRLSEKRIAEALLKAARPIKPVKRQRVAAMRTARPLQEVSA